MALRLLLVVASLAQNPDTQPHEIRWWEVAAVVGTVGLASVADHGLDVWIQNQRSSSSDALAAAFRTGGEPAVVLGIVVESRSPGSSAVTAGCDAAANGCSRRPWSRA